MVSGIDELYWYPNVNDDFSNGKLISPFSNLYNVNKNIYCEHFAISDRLSHIES